MLAQWALKQIPTSPTCRCSTRRPIAERAALQAMLLARLEYGRPFFLPPNVPADRVQALRRAFDATMKDPAYLAEADKLKIDVDPLTGEQVARPGRAGLAHRPRDRRPRGAAMEQVGRTTCGNSGMIKRPANLRFGGMARGGVAGRSPRTPVPLLSRYNRALTHPLPRHWKPIWMRRPLIAARSISHAWRMIRWCAGSDVTRPTPR